VNGCRANVKDAKKRRWVRGLSWGLGLGLWRGGEGRKGGGASELGSRYQISPVVAFFFVLRDLITRLSLFVFLVFAFFSFPSMATSCR